MNTIDADIVRRAVRVIDPAPKRHIECEEMVRTALAQIRAGERIVALGAHLLTEGQRVRVADRETASR